MVQKTVPSSTRHFQTQNSQSSQQASQKQPKVMITGDDILIEYVTRLSDKMASIEESLVSPGQKQLMERFISHYVWHMPDQNSNGQEADTGCY